MLNILVKNKPNSKVKDINKDFMNDIEIEEDTYGAGGGYGKDKRGYQSIVLEQYRKCCEEGSKEMTNGGVIKRIIDGEMVEMMSVDQVEIFINSVEMLKNLLIPSINKHDKTVGSRMKTIELEIENNDIKRRKAYHKLNLWYRNKSTNTNPDGYSEAQSNHTYYLQMNKEIKKIYHQNKLRTHKKLLEALGILLNKINYFDELGSWE